MSLEVYGSIIARRRRRFGLTIAQVAHHARLTEDQVRAAERGGVLTMVTLEALGRALVFDPAALLRGETLPDARRLPGWFRSHSSDASEAIAPDDARTLAVSAEIGEIGAFLRDQLDDGAPMVDELRRPMAPGDHDRAWQHGYELGQEARVRLARLARLDPAAPADRPLPSVQRTLEDLGVHIAYVGLSDPSKYAVSIVREGAMPVVLLNMRAGRATSAISRRAVLAHELGHLLHDVGETDLPANVRSSAPHREAVEKRANGFAPAFIAPPSALRQWEFGGDATPREFVRHLALDWGLSAEGATWHAKNVGLIDAAHAEELVADLSWRQSVGRSAGSNAGSWESDLYREDPRDHGLEVETSHLVVGMLEVLVVRSYNQGVISAGRAREILTIS